MKEEDVSRKVIESCASLRWKMVVCKDYIERSMNEENDWNHDVDGDAVRGQVDCVISDEIVQILNKMKSL